MSYEHPVPTELVNRSVRGPRAIAVLVSEGADTVVVGSEYCFSLRGTDLLDACGHKLTELGLNQQMVFASVNRIEGACAGCPLEKENNGVLRLMHGALWQNDTQLLEIRGDFWHWLEPSSWCDEIYLHSAASVD